MAAPILDYQPSPQDKLMIALNIIIIVTRPKPAYGWEGGARIKFKRVHFMVFSTSRFLPPALSLDWIMYV